MRSVAKQRLHSMSAIIFMAINSTYIDNSPILLLPHDGPSRLGASIRSLHMNRLNNVPFLVCHRLEGFVPQDSSIVDEDL